MPITMSDINTLFAHPFVLLLATALISNFLVPLFTKGWQEHRAEIELRSGFATRSIDAVLHLVLAVQLAERRSQTQSQADYDAAYKSWEISRATLGSEIRAFYRDSGLSTEWSDFAEGVTQLYVLSGTLSEPYRAKVIVELKKHFPDAEIDWDVLHHHQDRWESNDTFQEYFAEWWSLRTEILESSADFAKRLLGEPIASL